ncbi:MAG: YIP1 family protein [bacterium]
MDGILELPDKRKENFQKKINNIFDKFNLIFGIIAEPYITLIKFKNKTSIISAIAVFALATASLIISLLLISNRSVIQLKLASIYITSFFLLLLLWVVGSSIIHILCEFFNASGSAKSLFGMIGLSTSPLLLFIPITLIIMFFNWSPKYLFLITFIFVAIWVIVLLIKSIYLNYTISYNKIFLIVIIPVFSLLASILLIIIFSITSLTVFLGKLIPFG